MPFTKTPGPAPWYWTTFPTLRSESGIWYAWRLNNAGRLQGTVSLGPLRIFAKPVLAIKPDTVPFFIPYFGFGVWHDFHDRINIAVYDPDDLPPLDFHQIQNDIVNKSVRIIAMIHPHARMSIPKSLPEGSHPIEFPDPMKPLQELLFIGDYQSPDNYDHPRNTGNLDIPWAIYELNPSDSSITVHPLYFFNSTNFDLSTQRPTRVARDPNSGNFIIDGFRIDPIEVRIPFNEKNR